ncbi:MAG: HlyC/CorC family transporter [Gammaproteobacteria bacterium]|nr:HlyC/CorC family transporter [Gammaproteobacteria bacterium]
MDELQDNLLYLSIAILLVILNGFFVAAEFALVKVRGSKLEEMVRAGRPFAKTALWLNDHLDDSLSACQLGITMASLALGWVGEPAFARLLEPVFHAAGITSPAALHTTGFFVAFLIITSLHLVIGEQGPKIYAIRRPEVMILWCAVPLKFFYVLFYPFLIALSTTTSKLLQLVGIEGASEHDTPHTEAEIRTLIRQAVTHGELSNSEHQLIQGVFEFDDMICRRVMVPRSDVSYFRVDQPPEECLEMVRQKKHTRYPLCKESLENVLGIVHIKDLVGVDCKAQTVDLSEFAHPPHHVPETIPISQLLKHFQKTHQLMAIVVDEYGTVVGVVTLENVLEQIVGSVEDEFDAEAPCIVRDRDNQFLVQGATSLELVNQWFNLKLEAVDVDTLAGIMLERVDRLLRVGDKVELDGVVAEVIEVVGTRVVQVRVTVPKSSVSNNMPAEDK